MTFVIDKELDVAAPASVVWEVITDFARYPEWNPFVVECSCDLKPGAPIDMKVKLKGSPQKQREWILEVTPGKGFAYRMKPMPLGALSSYRSHGIDPLGEARCRYRSHFELKGWLRPVVLALFRKELEAGFRGMSEGIRRRSESLWASRRN